LRCEFFGNNAYAEFPALSFPAKFKNAPPGPPTAVSRAVDDAPVTRTISSARPQVIRRRRLTASRSSTGAILPIFGDCVGCNDVVLSPVHGQDSGPRVIGSIDLCTHFAYRARAGDTHGSMGTVTKDMVMEIISQGCRIRAEGDWEAIDPAFKSSSYLLLISSSSLWLCARFNDIHTRIQPSLAP
jgi:hypothetical protein